MISGTLQSKALAFLAEVESKAKEEGRQAAKAEFDKQLAAITGNQKEESEQTAPEPQTNDPVNENYSSAKVISELLAIKGNNPYAFGIVDVLGNVYADGKEWEQDGKPHVLGIGFTDGTHHLCMGAKAVSSCRYGDNGKYDGVFTSTDMWGKVLSDYSGSSNTEGIVKVTKNSIAWKCRELSGYLPAYAELNAYWKRFEEVDVLLKAIGGDMLRTTMGSQIMWTSTNKNDTTAYGLMYYSASKKSQPVAKTKTTSYPTRVFFNL